MSKMYNAVIACKDSKGNYCVSLTNNLSNRLMKFNQADCITFKTFTFDQSMTAKDIADRLLQDEFFIANDTFAWLLKNKAKEKVIKTNVNDILQAIKETEEKELV